MNGPGGHRTPIAGAGAGRAQDHYYRRRVFCAASDVPAPAWNSAGSARTLCGEEAMYGNGKVAEPGVVITLPLHDAMSMRAIGRVELLEKTTLVGRVEPEHRPCADSSVHCFAGVLPICPGTGRRLVTDRRIAPPDAANFPSAAARRGFTSFSRPLPSFTARPYAAAVNRWKIPAHDPQETIEALDAEFMREIGKARQCFADAMLLMKDGKTAEAKKLEREGDAAQKRAQQIFKQMKEAAQHRIRAR